MFLLKEFQHASVFEVDGDSYESMVFTAMYRTCWSRLFTLVNLPYRAVESENLKPLASPIYEWYSSTITPLDIFHITIIVYVIWLFD